MNRYGLRTGLAMAGATALALAACDDGRRAVEAPPPAPLAELEAMADLPYAEPARVDYSAPEQGYQWAERAYGLQRAVYDTPPDYGFAYEDVEPYVWETRDDWALYAEPWDGDYHYYYYEPGAAHPYFVRDQDYGYAFSPAGLLVAVFYADGRYVPADVAYRLAPAAGRYWARGQGLRRVGWKAPRTRVDERIWIEQAPRVTRSADPWLRAAREDGAWRAWRARDDDRELRRFAQETRRRETEAQAWRERADRPPPPPAATTRQETRRELRDVAQAARMERREDRAEAQQAARAEQHRRAEAQRQVQAARAEQRQAVQAEQRQARVQAQAEQRRAQAEQHRQLQAQQGHAERRQAQQQARGARAEAEARREAPRPPARAEARAPSAAERGQPAADRGRHDKGGGPGRGQDKKD